MSQAKCCPDTVTGPETATVIGMPFPTASSSSSQSRRRYAPPKDGSECASSSSRPSASITGRVSSSRRSPALRKLPGPVQRAGEMKAPILALQGGDDPGIPVEESQALDEALTQAGVEHEVVIYDGAPHSFFDR